MTDRVPAVLEVLDCSQDRALKQLPGTRPEPLHRRAKRHGDAVDTIIVSLAVSSILPAATTLTETRPLSIK
ncbi:hypothetical protein ACVWZL_009095 [Bradyrhizobium sp. GM2.4]